MEPSRSKPSRKQLEKQQYYERLIRAGQARLEDYEAYVRCQRNLALQQLALQERSAITPRKKHRTSKFNGVLTPWF